MTIAVEIQLHLPGPFTTIDDFCDSVSSTHKITTIHLN